MSVGSKRPQDTGHEIYLVATNTTGSTIAIFGQDIPAGQSRRIRMPVDKPDHAEWTTLRTRLAAQDVVLAIKGPGFDLLEGVLQILLHIASPPA